MTTNQDFNSNNQSQNELNVTNTVKSIGIGKTNEFFLNQDQVRQLLKFMPAGFSLVAAKSLRQQSKRMPSTVFNVDDSRAPLVQVEKKKRDAYVKAEQKLKEPVEFIRRCEYVLGRLKAHECAEPFMEPVDPEVLGIPDYFQIIKEPMDFSKVEKRLRSGFYKSPNEFEDDIRKIWNNATTYNKPNTEIYHMTLKISAFFDKLVKEEDGAIKEPPLSRAVSNKVPKKVTTYSLGDEPYRPPKGSASQKYISDKPLTYMEKKNLSEMIRQLPPDSLWDVCRIVSPNYQGQSESLEFDIDTLSPQTARELEAFVKSKLVNVNKKVKSKSQFKEPMPIAQSNLGYVPAPIAIAEKASSGIGQTRDALHPSTAETRNEKDDSSNSSFLSDISKSDE